MDSHCGCLSIHFQSIAVRWGLASKIPKDFQSRKAVELKSLRAKELADPATISADAAAGDASEPLADRGLPAFLAGIHQAVPSA